MIDLDSLDYERRKLAIRSCGCIACHMFEVAGIVPPQIHHLNEGDKHGGRRLGDRYTVGLCPWHHMGYPINDLTPGMCRVRLGPSWELEPNEFRKTFGLGVVLLEFQDALITKYLGTLNWAVP